MLTLRRESTAPKLVTLIAILLLVVNSSVFPSYATQKRRSPKARPEGSTPEQIFSIGFLYYNNNDIKDDKAARQFQYVIDEFPASQEAEKAQFFLGSYYQRKYNIQAQKGISQGSDELLKAKDAYEAYVRKYPQGGPCQCLSDAYFHLSLVYMQLGDRSRAQSSLTKMREGIDRIDPEVYIYQVVWSPSPKDVIDSHFNTTRLADYAIQISGSEFDKYANLLKVWCKSQKSR